jgi:hypothetical protein
MGIVFLIIIETIKISSIFLITYQMIVQLYRSSLCPSIEKLRNGILLLNQYIDYFLITVLFYIAFEKKENNHDSHSTTGLQTFEKYTTKINRKNYLHKIDQSTFVL